LSPLSVTSSVLVGELQPISNTKSSNIIGSGDIADFIFDNSPNLDFLLTHVRTQYNNLLNERRYPQFCNEA